MIKCIVHHKLLKQAAILCSCLFFFACENDDRAINEWTEKVVMVEEATKVETFFSQNGKLRARLTAPLMIRSQADTSYTEFPKTLHVDFYDSLLRKESFLDARYGKYFEHLNKVWLRDSIRVISINGDTLTTSELWWDQNIQKFYTDKEVRIATKTKNIYGGKGMEATQDLSVVTIRYPSGTALVQDNF